MSCRYISFYVLFLSIFFMHPSWAVFGPGCQCGAISSFHSATRSHVSKETTLAAREIIEALQAHSAQQSKYLDRQVEAQKRITDAEQQIHSRRLREKFRAEAESGRFDPNPDFCHLVDLSSQGAPKQNQLAKEIINVTTANWSLGNNEIVQKNGIRMAAWLQKEKKTIGVIDEIEQPTIDWSLVTDQPTIPINEPYTIEAISRLVSNTVDPIPPIPIPESLMITPNGLSEAVIRDSIHARKNAAMKAIEHTVKLNLPSEPAEIYQNFALLSGYKEEILEQVSPMQALDIRTMMYFAPTLDTLKSRQQKNEKALLQDLIDLTSLNTKINYLRLEQELRTALVLASILSVQTDGGYTNLVPD